MNGWKQAVYIVAILVSLVTLAPVLITAVAYGIGLAITLFVAVAVSHPARSAITPLEAVRQVRATEALDDRHTPFAP